MKKLFAIVLGAALVSANASADMSSVNLRGVWKIAEVTNTGPNATTLTKPQPGLAIFTDRHFSIVMVTGDKVRAALPKDRSKATAAELMGGWGEFVAGAGTYQLDGNKLTRQPQVAKEPSAMRPGVVMTETIKLHGNALWITQVSGPDGPATNPRTFELTRCENASEVESIEGEEYYAD